MNFLIFKGPSWKNCGESGGQAASLASDQAFQNMLTSQYKSFAGQNQGILTDLTSNLESIFNAGPSQQGMSPTELATQNSQVINNAAAANKQVQQQIGETAGMSGVPGVQNGVTQALKAEAATNVESNLSNEEATITNQNYALGRANYLNAEQGLISAPEALEGATNQAAGVVNNSNVDTANEANAIQASNQAATSGWIGLATGMAGDAASAYAGKKNS